MGAWSRASAAGPRCKVTPAMTLHKSLRLCLHGVYPQRARFGMGAWFARRGGGVRGGVCGMLQVKRFPASLSGQFPPGADLVLVLIPPFLLHCLMLGLRGHRFDAGPRSRPPIALIGDGRGVLFRRKRRGCELEPYASSQDALAPSSCSEEEHAASRPRTHRIHEPSD